VLGPEAARARVREMAGRVLQRHSDAEPGNAGPGNADEVRS
jgi:hypothetical protein